MVIFISGPMSGYQNYNREAFNKAEELLEMRGHIVLNPARLPDGLTREQCMAIDMEMVKQAEGVFMLRGWTKSEGARKERDVACNLKKSIFYANDDAFVTADIIPKTAAASTILPEVSFTDECVMTASDLLQIILDNGFEDISDTFAVDLQAVGRDVIEFFKDGGEE